MDFTDQLDFETRTQKLVDLTDSVDFPRWEEAIKEVRMAMVEAGSPMTEHCVLEQIRKSIKGKNVNALHTYSLQCYNIDDIFSHVKYILGSSTALMRDLKIRLLALHKVTSEAVMYTNACSFIKHIETIEAKASDLKCLWRFIMI